MIEPSHSNYNSPILLVPKKGGTREKKWRLVFDYSRLNAKLIPDKFPLPRIDDILDSLGNAKYFSILDLYSGFHQIKLEKGSRELTAFTIDNGIYQWRVLPFGLNIAPNAFCRMMQIAFSGISPDKCFIYMDDIIVIGKNEMEHLENLRSVFQTCRDRSLKLNPEKVNFFQMEVTFLGHKCTQNGILPDQSKIESVKKYPVPKNGNETKRFTAFANYYRRFIKNFSTLIKPLTKLTGKYTPFIWTEECQKSFEEIKRKIINPPILQYPDHNKEFIITVDASQIGCGAVLSQIFDGNDLPIQFASRTFEKGELNKDIVEKELLAIHFAILTFEPYIFGKHFTVRSDHKPLISLYKLRNPTGKLARIKLSLSDKDFTIEHIPGRLNVVADALSRMNISDLSTNYKNDVTMFTMICQEQETMRIKHFDIIEIFERKNETEKVMNVMTRQQAKSINMKKEQVEQNEQNDSNDKVMIYEDSNQKKSGIPMMSTSNNKMRAHYKNKLLFEIELNVAKETSLEDLLSMIEKISGENDVKEINWPLNDSYFEKVDIETFKIACNKVLKNLKIYLKYPIMTITDNNEKLRLLKLYHDDPLWGGHSGQKKLLSKLRESYYWKNMSRDVTKYVKDCQKCLLNKVKSGCKAPMKLVKTPQQAMDVIVVDTLGPLPVTKNQNKFAITMICDLTKFIIIAPTQDKSAKTVAKSIFENLIATFGPIKELRSDRGTEFVNETVSELCKLMNIDQKISTPYHHETVGSIERNHRTFNEYVRNFIANIEEWDEYIPHFTFCYNISKHSSFNDKYSPFELIFGKRARNVQINTEEITPVYNWENYSKELKFRLELCHKEARQILDKIKLRNKEYRDKCAQNFNYKIGDKFLIKKEPYNKHGQINDGPFVVIDKTEQNLIYRGKNDKVTSIHINRTIKL